MNQRLTSYGPGQLQSLMPVKEIGGMCSGKERVHSDVIICPLIGLTELQGHHANLACYQSDIMPPGYARSIIWKLEVNLVKNIHIGLVVILTIVPVVAVRCSAGYCEYPDVDREISRILQRAEAELL